ncbi:Bifunctional polynucleotide phosphatase/kinase [Armadillidium nasatum]|uniref:Bifunctional polynucleotide phosphatase/kinase n=1 Tax=Armadillidium nasatum TaxID=96803 RepID=A0A5N5TLA9_9CRUS|nr:Bifunctional polynucleotide phosphatase/kinase [Armadillidium nasatum]
MAKRCFIKCINKIAAHDPILLEDKISHILGRSKITKIKTSKCSKEQVELTANYANFKVKYKHIGPNDGGYMGKAVKCGEVLELKHKDVIEFLFGLHPHEIVFDPEPNESLSPVANAALKEVDNSETLTSDSCSDEKPVVASKRKLDTSSDNISKKLCTNSSDNTWENYNNELLVYNKRMKKCDKIAAYDLDGTLITTASGRVFPKDVNDWKILYTEVPGKLKQLYKDGYKIVIFTNQLGVSRGKISVKDIQSKIQNVINKLGVSAQALVSTGKGKYRKPFTGMWDFFLSECNEGLRVDKEESFYVGDAAGRPEISKKRKKDHSSADRLFAINIDIQFLTPEEHFLGKSPLPYNMPEFIPSSVDDTVSLYNPATTKVPKYPVEVAILVGYPGSGKSTFVEKHLLKLGYIQANRDQIGSWQKCVALMEKYTKEGKHVVIDNTNPDKESRSRYIAAAKNANIPVRCFKLDVSLEHAKHNNRFREVTGSDHDKINEMVYNIYKSKYEEPSLAEGFTDIVKVNFVPIFKNSEMERIYKLFLLEK